MTATISRTGDFMHEVEITRMPAVDEIFHVEFTSRLATAKNPAEKRKNCALMLHRDELLTMRALIEKALA